MHTKLPIISSYKNSSFRLPNFRRIREILQIRNLMTNCLRMRDQMVYLIFSESCLSRHQGFQKIPKWKKVFVKTDWLLTMITNHFEIPVVQNLETFLFYFFALGFILFLEVSAKFMMTKYLKHKFLHFTHMLTSSNVYIFQKCMKTFMIKKTNKNCP